MASEIQDEKAIFNLAREIVSPDARAEYLRQACGADSALRERVQVLLRAYEEQASFLESPPPVGASHTIDQPASESPGAVIGPYKLIEHIGEGGMGTVWMAQQTEPVKRVVALKLIKAGMDSKQIIARFEAERQALALMDHPNIAKVLDGGTTSEGRPYFVMDLVKGVSITKYCDDHHLTPRQRLELFIPVCQAVQHAHQKGIIHRDLKPSNVLVALYDGKPVPKVIDFGVAKAAGQSLTEQTLVTGLGNIVGTLEYMSPEQAELNQLDIDTRSDIYSLGVLLYELLTGSPPFSRKELEKAGMLEMLRVIREQEPSKPSTKLSTAEGLPTLAANRGTEPAKLTKLVRGELDWIVMKALDKDRNRRYETANGFAQDVQRYLADEPVQACPPSAGYRLRKFARKHRGPLWAAATIALLLVLGIAVSTWQAVRATEAEWDAVLAQEAETERAEGERLAKLDAKAKETKAVEAAEAAKKANDQAQKRLAQIQNLNAILAKIFADLDIRKVREGTEPLEAVLAQRLVTAAAQIEGEAVGDPRLVADLQHRLGLTLLNLGYPNEAIDLFVKALDKRIVQLGAHHLDTLTSMNNLASAYQAAGKLNLALPLFEDTLKFRKAKLGTAHPNALTSMNNLALAYKAAGKLDLALPLLEDVLKLRKTKQGPGHPDTLMGMNNLASAYQAAGKLDLALPLLTESRKLMKVKLGADHPATLTIMNNLAVAYKAAGKLNLALPLFEDTLKFRKAKLGAHHPDTLDSMNNLASALQAAGKLDLSLPLFEDTLKLRKSKLGDHHPDTLKSMHNLAGAYRTAGKLDLALPLHQETLKLQKATLGADHPDTLDSMNNLAVGYQAAGKLDLALPLYEETLEVSKTKLGADHPNTLTSMNNLAAAYQAAGKLDLALPLLEETLKLRKAKQGADHPHTLNSMNNLAATYQTAGKLDLALPLLEETLKLRKAKLGAYHLDTLTSMNNLAVSYQDAGRLDLALALFQEAATGLEKKGIQHEYADWIINSLIRSHEKLKQFDQAEVWRWKWLAVVKKQTGPDSVAVASELLALGQNQISQKKWIDAEVVLRECLAIGEKKQPAIWTTFHAQSMLGDALLGQKKYVDAEPLLLGGYKGLKQRAAQIPPQVKQLRLTEALKRLVQVYDAWDRPDEAAKWRKELEALMKAGKIE